MAIPTTTAATLNAVPPHDLGRAAGVANTLRRLGGVFEVAPVSAIFASSGHLSSPAASVAEFRSALTAAAGLSVLGAMTALRSRVPIRT